MTLRALLLLVLPFWLYSGIGPGRPARPGQAYAIEDIALPEGLSGETGGLGFLPDGRLVACFIRGEVMTYNPATRAWKLFAEGLHEPLGLWVVSNSEILVMQRPELTRLRDTDGDGQADHYENVTDQFGLSGNYHEFNYGPVQDKAGNLYFSLNTASPGGAVRPELRGTFKPLGRDTIPGLYQMFSPVPYRGWVMQLSPQGTLIPFASGLRSPNGLGFDQQGNLFVTDNQSDWVETSTLYHVQAGKFYGHPASLVWEKDWNRGNPFLLPETELDQMRTQAAVLFPQGIMANSPTQPLCDLTAGKFGPFAGQLFVGEMNRARLLRVMLEQVGGEWQGACIPFIDAQGLRKGNNRLAFAPDGSLWVGQIAYGWGGDKGIQRITYTGQAPVEVYTMKLSPQGFELTFTQPLAQAAARKPENYQFRHYYYPYHKKGKGEGVDLSRQTDVQPVAVKDIQLSADGKKVRLALDKLKPGYIYELKLGDITSADGTPLANKLLCYTLNKLIADKP